MTFAIPVPLRDSYQVAPVDQTVRTDMEFGAARMRRRTSARLDTVQVQWVFTAAEMTAFRSWYDTDIAGGSAWFSLPLNVGDGRETRDARFASPWKSTQEGIVWRVSATVEVR